MSTIETPITGTEDVTKEELYERAQELDVEGRSQMDKDELAAAVELAEVGPDAVTLLTEQHDRFRELFDAFEALSDRPSQKKADLVREMVTVLVKHAEVEEQVLYPAARDEVEGVEADVEEDLEEHHVAELLLSELDHMTPESPRFDAKVAVLIENVRHHMDEEEQELFPALREQMTETRRRELGAAMIRLWEIAPTRPHPLSPDTPPANFLMGIPATAWDLTVGAARTARRLVFRRR